MSIDPSAMQDNHNVLEVEREVSGRRTLASYFVTILTDHCAGMGLPEEQLFQICGLDPVTLKDPEQRFPLASFLRLCEVAAEALDDPGLGLSIGALMTADHLGPYGFALMSSDTAREMMAKAERYSVLAIGGGKNVFDIHEDVCIRYWRHEDAENTAGWRIMDELVMASAVTMTRTLLGDNGWSPEWVSFTTPAPEDMAPYEKIFQCPLRFDSDAYAIAFDPNLLDVELRRVHPQVKLQLDKLCEDLLASLASAEDPAWLTRCRTLVVAALESPPPELSAIASELNMSPSTLRKRLAERSTNFRHLVDEIRSELASAYLRQQGLSLVDIAYLLGFSEQSAFQRAFKRWTGKTPGEYRVANELRSRSKN